MLDLKSEQILRLAEACRHLPPRRGGETPHAATLYRWAKGGLRGIKLETIRVGGTLCTSLEALQRFCDRLTDADRTTSPAPVPASPTSRSRAAERAGRMLDLIGI